MYREDSNSLLLVICLGLTVFVNTAHLIFSIFRSTREAYVKSSIDVLGMMGVLTFLGAIAIYLDADFVNRGSRYDINTFYPVVQASILQGVASLIFLLIHWFIRPTDRQ
jgi:hypothetical protein